MDVLLQDLRYAVRALRRAPGYTAVIVTVMALGIGVNTMVFSMVYGVLFRPMPIINESSLVSIEQLDPKRHSEGFEVSFKNFQDFRARSKSFSSMGAWWDHNGIVKFGDDSERLEATTMTVDLLPTLGVQPILGRGFLREEEEWGKNWSSMLISHRIWKQRYNSDSKVLGKTLRINGRPRTIVGVLPEGFLWPETQDFFLPMGYNAAEEGRNDFAIEVLARLKPGVSVKSAETELRGIMTQIRKEDPTAAESVTARAGMYQVDRNRFIRPMMILMMAAVGFVLLIACANVANLMLARAAGRRREIALRMSLGASRARVMRQLFTESIVVSMVGAALGVILAHWGNRAWLSMIPLELPWFMNFDIDTPVLLFTVAISVFSGLLFGLAPALYATDTRLTEALREGSIQAGSSRGRNRIREALVIAEVALSLVLLVGTGLMVRSFMNKADQQKTIQANGVMTGVVLLPVATYPEAEQRRTFFRTMVADLAATPGVEAASAAAMLPLGRNSNTRAVSAERHADKNPNAHAPLAYANSILPGYFNTLGIRILKGRDFTYDDDHEAPPVTIVSQRFADAVWPKKDPIGQRLHTLGEPDSVNGALVIGVVADVMQRVEGGTERAVGNFYRPHAQEPNQQMILMVRSNLAPGAVATRMRQLVKNSSADLAVYDVRSMNEYLAFSMWMNRLFSTLLSTLAIIALVIAAIGIYGVMAYSVAQRTQEIGIRMALGADPGSVIRMVVGHAMRITVIGAVIGIGAALGLTQLMASQLFGVDPTDPPTYAGVAVVLALSAIIAAWLPAQRAARIQPLEALRYE